MKKEFTHLDKNSNPQMVDVSGKNQTTRTARSQGYICLPREVMDLLNTDGDISTKKGPVFQTARIAATMAVKKTADLIPLCHPLMTEGVAVEITTDDSLRAWVECSVTITGKTGVEMESLTGVSVGLLTIYDMCKAFGKDMEIGGIHLIEKKGGKSDYNAKAKQELK